MLRILENENEIKKAQENFERALKTKSNKRIPVKIGYRGGYEEGKVYYSDKYDIWFYFGGPIEGEGKNKRKRFWSVFGAEEPKPNSNVSIIVEINSPVKGIYRRIGGAFAKDDEENIWLLHRGKIGGGRKRIGKSLFMKNYSGQLQAVADGDQENDLAIIGQMDDSNFPSKIADFVREVERIKELVD